ncbi:MAG TPA: hypothetical protein VFH07_08655, partial [Chitinophagaceae bacterium]|nr:hypothetical protein [Chitinophagaceae bacterium]
MSIFESSMPNPFQIFFKNLFGLKANNSALSDPELPIPPETANDFTTLISRVLPYFGTLNDAKTDSD